MQQNFFIPGPAGNLETLAEFTNEHESKYFAVICHPHPLQGGTMHNKIVSTLARTFKALHIPTLRFNFRGVGHSEGLFDKAQGEVDDCLAVIDYAKAHYPFEKLILAGFSFGSYIAARAAASREAELLISVAPPVPHYDFKTLPAREKPWIVVQADDDEVFNAQAVYDWLATLKNPPTLIQFSKAGHFFHGNLIPLREQLIKGITDFEALELDHENT
jgi:alpha/beta superfamily hydrolase